MMIKRSCVAEEHEKSWFFKQFMGSYESNELTIGSVLENRDQGFLLASFLKIWTLPEEETRTQTGRRGNRIILTITALNYDLLLQCGWVTSPYKIERRLKRKQRLRVRLQNRSFNSITFSVFISSTCWLKNISFFIQWNFEIILYNVYQESWFAEIQINIL